MQLASIDCSRIHWSDLHCISLSSEYVNHLDAAVAKEVEGLLGWTFCTIPLDGLQINTLPPLLIADEAVLAGTVQLLLSHDDVLCILHGSQTVGMITVQMRQQHVVEVSGFDAHHLQLLIDSLAKRYLSLIHIIQYTRAKTLNLSRFIIDTLGRHITVPPDVC